MREFEVDRGWAYRDLRSGRSSGTGRIDRSKCSPRLAVSRGFERCRYVARWGTGGCRSCQRGGGVGGEGAAQGGGKKSRKDGTGRHGTPRQCLCVLAPGSCRPTGRRGVDLTAHSTARRRSAQVCGQDFGFGRVRSTCASRSPWTRIPTGPEARPRQCAGHRARTTDTEDLPRNPARESTAPLL
jgi:hypothetical protein